MRSLRAGFWSVAVCAGLCAVAATSGCSDSLTDLNCPDRGCAGGLELSFDAPLPDGTILRLELLPGPWEVTCGGDVDCSGPVLFEGIRADRVEIVIIRGSDERRFVVTPEYEEIRPNGPTCPGLCFLAKVVVAVS